MIYVLYHPEIGFWNVDNETDRDSALENGAREVTQEELVQAGIAGNENKVAPENTKLLEDGSIEFILPLPSLEEVKAAKIKQIDADTSAAIIDGFDCEVIPPDTGLPEKLHFSYDTFDQQNFADAAVSMQLAPMSGGDIPTMTPWNAYRNHTDTNKGDLVVLLLTAETFLPIYAAALNHKAKQMAIGGQKKVAVQAATSVEEVEAIE